MRNSRKARGWQKPAAWAVVFVALCLALGTMVLKAQDEPAPLPDGAANLFMPAVSSDSSGVQAGDIIPGQYIVVLKDPAVRAASGQLETAAQFAEHTVQTYGGALLFTYDAALSGFAAILPAEGAAAMAADPNVDYIEPDQVVAASVEQTNPTWGLDRIDQRDLPLNSRYSYNNAGAGVHVYIVDTGVLGTHQEFAGRMGAGYTAIADGRGTTDCNGHGTHVAGTAAGVTYGVAKQATIHPVRVLGCNGSGTNSGVIAGINWVTANHIKPAVANMSLGGSASSTLDAAVRNSIAAGVVYAVAAGNENVDACQSSPARTAEALTVGATTNTDARASFSNYGSCLDIFAPGAGIVSAYHTGNSATASLSGTSMASPHVAGAAALYLAANPAANPSAVATALTGNATASKVSNPGSGSVNRLLYTAFIDGGTAPTPTPTATVPAPTATPTSTPAPGACTNKLANPGFEQGRTVWSTSSTKGYNQICTQSSCGGAKPPRTGSYLAWLGGGNSETSEVSQRLVLPAGQSAYLSYWYQIASTDYCNYDYAYVRITSGTTRTLATYSLCTARKTASWVNQRIDISSYAGKTVTVTFRVKNDASLVSSFFVDDTAIVNGASCTTASSDVTAAEAPIETPAELPADDLAPSDAPKADAPAGATEFSR